MNITLTLSNHLNGRNIFTKVIPTVNTLTNLFKSLEEKNWDYRLLKGWEKPIYNAYNFDGIQSNLKVAKGDEKIQLIKNHLLNQDPNKLGAHPICIYLIAFYLQQGHPKKISSFEEFVVANGISEKKMSAQAIWSVGVNDGKYLGLFDDQLNISDWSFFESWTTLKSSVDIHKKTVDIESPQTITAEDNSSYKNQSNIFDPSHLEYFLSLPNDSKVFMGPNSLSWSTYVTQEQIEGLQLLNKNFYRDQLLEFCADKRHSDMLTLLAVLSWGGMHREHGKKLLRSSETVLDIVNKLRNNYFESRKEAFNYIQMQRKNNLLPGLGIGYFTKLICFMAPELKGYIMDQWVAKAINLITDNKIVKIDRSHWVTDENNCDDYEKFCFEVDRIGEFLKTDGYKAEEKLFSIGGRTKGAWRKYVIEKYVI